MFVTSTIRRSTLLPLCTPHFYFVADSWNRVFVLFFYCSVTIPTVAIVDHELPDARETIAHIIHAATRNILGFRICSP